MQTVLDLQRRTRQSGRIRLGYAIDTGKTGKGGQKITRPARSDKFRFTSPSRPLIEAVAAYHGGEPRPWEDGGRREWEVFTEAEELFVSVPPGVEAITTNYELWRGGGCERRCDSQHEQKTGGPCLCPHAANPDDAEEVNRVARLRHEMSKRNPPEACGLKTRVNLVLPDLPDIGVWRLDTGSFYAAGELLGHAELMELCVARNVFLPARLWIDHRTEVVRGQTRRYPVPALELAVTFRQVVTGELEAGGWAAQLPPPAQPRAAITAAATTPALPSAPAPAPAPVSAAVKEPPAGPDGDDEVVEAEIVDDEPPQDAAPAGTGGEQPSTEPMTAQQIADAAATMATTPEQVAHLIKDAQAGKVAHDDVTEGGYAGPLLPYLLGRRRTLMEAA
jgi:Recombination directionality factor-like